MVTETPTEDLGDDDRPPLRTGTSRETTDDDVFCGRTVSNR